ncbi:uncharacterized protein BO88DRAFT_486187 [Aspergillus vadensis CBS 113365]|uniref:Uncharacterized protein n=1 Tax=Aspergillus vadensis (strain CBS 113365 / IMI 142717 / IBT 24658) TaxID=1448311 RepID=A0A319C0J4_ASPVC|nr:hypothetical protein BO88DRAFT_486187 [Aspergillus vadensis CBS 113365]PYH71693.1 hypothetical protein BO88DRAFT_486187 [Aspergillus vadensis CBS 113365]
MNDIRSVIQRGEFYSLPVNDLLQLIHNEYPTELARLKTAYSIPVRTRPHHLSEPSPSQIIYHDEHDEVNRTLVSLLLLRKIHNNDYAGFVGNQRQTGVRHLRKLSFAWIRRLFRRCLTTSDDLHTLITSIIINDLGKSPTLAADLQRQKATVNACQGKPNHDVVLDLVVREAPHLIPCLEKLSPSHGYLLVRGIELGAEFNFGQMAQAECPPASLLGLERLRPCHGDDDNDKHISIQVFHMRYMEQILDIAGALGHQDHTNAALFTEPIYQSYRIIYQIALDVINGNIDRREAYDANLVRKLELLMTQNGWRAKGRGLDVHDPEHRALMRLLCICNATATKGVEVADLVWETFFDGIDPETRLMLVKGLNIDGSERIPAVQATYAPAVCSAAIKASRSEGRKEQKKALAAVFCYLARVHTLTPAESNELPDGVMVVERDVRDKVLSVVTSDSFRSSPDVLNDLDVPEIAIAVQRDPRR